MWSMWRNLQSVDFAIVFLMHNLPVKMIGYETEFDEDDAGSDNLFHNGIMLSYRARHNAEG